MDLMRHGTASRARRPRTSRRIRLTDVQPAFWVLTGLLLLVFATGGSSRGDVPQLILLRPGAILVAGYGLATLTAAQVHRYRWLFALAAATVLLTALHLVPLPPALWHALPGRALVEDIDAAAGLGPIWRPLSLTPSRTWNALFSLAVPVATLAVAAQLSARDLGRMLYVLLGLGAVTAFVGVLQAAGFGISLFHFAGGGSDKIEASGLFANKNHQAALLAAMIPMLAVVAGWGRSSRLKRSLGALAGIGAIAIAMLLIVTGSRAGLAVGAVAIVATMFYGLMPSGWLDRVPARAVLPAKLAIAAAVIGAAVLITSLAARGLAVQRLETATEDLRTTAWRTTLDFLPDYMPWGSGIGSFVEIYRAHEPTALLRESYWNHAHNDFLEVLMTAGVPGALLLLGAGVLLAIGLWRNRQASEPGTILARLGGVILVILALASLTDYPLRTPLLSAVAVIAALWCARRAPEGAADGRGRRG